MNATFDRHALYGEGGGDDCLVVLCGEKRGRECVREKISSGFCVS